jgi:uncharacterized repeat protein (TIGR03803 family)
MTHSFLIGLSRVVAPALALLAATTSVARAQTADHEVLVNLQDTEAGYFPHGGLIQANDGNFYGRTGIGGALGGGTVFRMTPAGEVTVLHDFAPIGVNCHNGPLIQGTDGALYGTNSGGGNESAGEVYRLTLGGTFTSLHSFKHSDTVDGYYPCDGVVQGTDGALYGTTYGGGVFFGRGTAYRLALDGSTFQTIHSFGLDYPLGGYIPWTRLVVGSDGALYGRDNGGGLFAQGMAYRLAQNMSGVWEMTTFYHFSSANHCQRPAAFMRGSDGAFYGVTWNPTTSASEVYRLTPGGNYQVLHSFDIADPDGYQTCAVVQGRDGAFYGTTSDGGLFGRGVIYRVTAGGAYLKLHDFAADQSLTLMPLLKAADGTIYGITSGWFIEPSAIFKLTIDVTVPTVRVTANGSDLPITVNRGAPLKIEIGFDAPGAGLASANVALGVVSPLGLLWLLPTGLTTTPSVFYSGALPDLGPITLFNFSSTAGFLTGNYHWFMIVHDPSTNQVALSVSNTLIQ